MAQVGIVTAKAVEKHLELELYIDEELLNKCFLGDSKRIQQVLLNLLWNSLKFTMEGYVKLNAKLLADGETSVQAVQVSSERYFLSSCAVRVELQTLRGSACSLYIRCFSRWLTPGLASLSKTRRISSNAILLSPSAARMSISWTTLVRACRTIEGLRSTSYRGDDFCS